MIYLMFPYGGRMFWACLHCLVQIVHYEYISYKNSRLGSRISVSYILRIIIDRSDRDPFDVCSTRAYPGTAVPGHQYKKLVACGHARVQYIILQALSLESHKRKLFLCPNIDAWYPVVLIVLDNAHTCNNTCNTWFIWRL